MKMKTKVICVTGGKGGTGKTLCAVNIAVMFKNKGYKTLLIDGDSENPNTYLLLGGTLDNKQEVPFFIPRIVQEKCTKCGLCAENCVPHALLHIKDAFPIPMLTLCSGCKLCYKICPAEAIEPDYKTIGWIYSTMIRGLSLLIGELKPGEARSASIVEKMIEILDEAIEAESDKYDVIILDTAPGAHCDVEALIKRADYVIPVTEPTPFGKTDLIRIIELIELLGKKYRAIINRSSLLGFKDKFLADLKENNIPILGDIPLDDDIVASYCQGIPLMDEESSFNKEGMGYRSFQIIFNNILKWIENSNEI